MSRADFAYAQARLHARLAGRLTEADWQRLEASRDLAHCLDAAAGTQARAFSERLDRGSGPHTIERVMREVWAERIAELAAWLPEAWRAAVAWMMPLPHLARVEAAANGGQSPDWLTPERTFPDSWPELTETEAVSESWLSGWLARCPDGAVRREAQLDLAPVLARYLGRGHLPPVRADGNLAETLVSLFRSRAQTPVAIFAYVLLTALDTDRLRGILVNRALFPGGV